LKHKGYNTAYSGGNATAQKFGYNGKELEENEGLNWLEYGVRNYDATLGRWINIDLLSEKYYEHTPYSYVGSNPIIRTDPIGLDWYTDADGNLQYNSDLNKDNASEILTKGQNYYNSSFHISVKNNKTSIHYLNKDGSVSDKNGKKIDSGASIFVGDEAHSITAHDDKPANSLTKNGDYFPSNDGNSYRFNNNRWVKLSGRKVNSLAYFSIGSTGFVSMGSSNDVYVDEALMISGGKLAISKGLDADGLIPGIVISSVDKNKISRKTPKALTIAFIFNIYTGIFKQYNENKKHDKEVSKAISQIKQKEK